MLARLLRFRRRWRRAFSALCVLARAGVRGRVLRGAAAVAARWREAGTLAAVVHGWQKVVWMRREGVRRLRAVRQRGEQRRLLLVAVGSWIRRMDSKRVEEEGQRREEAGEREQAALVEAQAEVEAKCRSTQQALEQAQMALEVEQERGEQQLEALRSEHVRVTAYTPAHLSCVRPSVLPSERVPLAICDLFCVGVSSGWRRRQRSSARKQSGKGGR